jgi:hypothetical protein
MSKAATNQSTPTLTSVTTAGDVWDGDQIHTRYVSSIDDLVRDSIGIQATHVLADALTLTLARMVVYYKPFVAGDILRRFGEHICAIDERNRAVEQAAEAKLEGRIPH